MQINETFYFNPDDENSVKYYQERSKWANENNVTIQEIGTVEVDVEVTYQEDVVRKYTDYETEQYYDTEKKEVTDYKEEGYTDTEIVEETQIDEETGEEKIVKVEKEVNKTRLVPYTYIEDEQVLKTRQVPVEREVTEPVEKTRIEKKEFRQFQIVEIPERQQEELQESKRAERDNAINAIMWRIERYEQQVKLEVETTDSEETYMSILAYVQYLRDFTKQENWWKLEVPSFEGWK